MFIPETFKPKLFSSEDGYAVYDPSDLRTEIYIDGQWISFADIDGVSVRGEGQGITISRGGKNEYGRVSPTAMHFTLTDPEGKFNDQNPRSEYFGLIGPNTLVRHSGYGPALEDDYNRSQSDSWAGGSFTWTNNGGIAANYDVNGTHGTHTHTDTAVLRHSYATVGTTDMRVRATFKLSAGTLTGANASVWVMGRFTDTSNYYAASVAYTTAGDVTVGIYKRVAGALTVIANPITTHTGYSGLFNTYQFTCELYLCGSRISARLWDSTNHDEPLPFNLAVTDTSLTAGSLGGVADRRETGNTNANLEFQYDSFLAVPGTIRATVEIPNMGALQWRPGGKDVHLPLRGSGIKGRLGIAGKVLNSALFTAMEMTDDLIGWQPLEDGEDSTQAASGLPNGVPMSIQSGLIDFITEGPPGAAGAVNMRLTGSGAMSAQLPDNAATAWQVAMWVKGKPGDTTYNEIEVLEIATTAASNPTWKMLVASPASGSPAGSVQFAYYDSAGTVVAGVFNTADTYPGYLDEQWHLLQATVTQNGANVDAELFVDGVSVDTGTFAGLTLGSPVRWTTLSTTPPATDVFEYIHISALGIWANATVVDLYSAGYGFEGETAGERFERICGQLGIAYEILGVTADTARMGPQRVGGALQNLEDCEDSDGGILFEPRHFFGLTYRTASDLYNQSGPDFPYTGGYLSGEPFPDPESQQRANDVTATRYNGSKFRVTRTTGPRSIQQPPNGMGHYPKPISTYVESDGQLPDIAGWGEHIGTWPSSRYPNIKFELHRTVFSSNETATAQVARLDIGDYYSISSPPTWLPPETIELLARGYEEKRTNKLWEIKFASVPAGPYNVAIRGNSYADGRVRNSFGSTLASGAAAGATSLSVSTPLGPLWVTGSVDFDVMIEGVRLHVTSISGASSPQTFTVDATPVNGISKALSSGSPVDVYPLARRALSGPDANGVYILGSGRTVRGLDTPISRFINVPATITTASTTWVTDANPVGTVFIAPSTGGIMIYIAATLDNTTAGGETYVSYEIREGPFLGLGDVFASAAERRAVLNTGTNDIGIGTPFLATVFTPGKMYNLVLWHRVSAGTGTISRRIILVKPVGSTGGLSGTYIQGEPGTTRDIQDTSDTSTSTAYTTADMTPCGNFFVAPASGKVLVHIASKIDNSGANSTYVSFRIGTGAVVGAGTEFLAPADSRALENLNTDQVRYGQTHTVTGLTSGDTYNVQLMHRVTAGTGTLEFRHVAVEPTT